MTPSDRQLGDAAGVLAIQGEKLDLKAWANQLSVEGELDRLLTGQIKPKHT